jgi:hypothetical protein
MNFPIKPKIRQKANNCKGISHNVPVNAPFRHPAYWGKIPHVRKNITYYGGHRKQSNGENDHAVNRVNVVL